MNHNLHVAMPTTRDSNLLHGGTKEMQAPYSRSLQMLSARLRSQAEAEEILRGNPPTLDHHTSEEVLELLRELTVSQNELIRQNEELCRTQSQMQVLYSHYFDLYDLAPVGYVTLDGNDLIVEANLTAAKLLCVDREVLPKKSLPRFIDSEHKDIYYCHQKRLFETRMPQVCELRILRTAADPFWARMEASMLNNNLNEAVMCRITISDISAQKRAETERDHLIRELQGRLAKAKLLEGILPICSYCKRIRDTDDTWKMLESYIGNHSEALFSHSLCPNCVSEHYPEALIKSMSGQPEHGYSPTPR